MTDTEYKGGPLPEPTLERHPHELWGQNVLSDFYTADQMRAYAAQEVAAERERCAAAAWNHYMDTCHRLGRAPSMWHEWCASNAIRRTAP